jgi:hypothetical protein
MAPDDVEAFELSSEISAQQGVVHGLTVMPSKAPSFWAKEGG